MGASCPYFCHTGQGGLWADSEHSLGTSGIQPFLQKLKGAMIEDLYLSGNVYRFKDMGSSKMYKMVEIGYNYVKDKTP